MTSKLAPGSWKADPAVRGCALASRPYRPGAMPAPRAPARSRAGCRLQSHHHCCPHTPIAGMSPVPCGSGDAASRHQPLHRLLCTAQGLPHTYVVGLQVRVVLLDAIIQDGNHDALARVALLPGLTHIQVPLVGVVLPKEALMSSAKSNCWSCERGVRTPPDPSVQAAFALLSAVPTGVLHRAWGWLRRVLRNGAESQRVPASHSHSSLCQHPGSVQGQAVHAQTQLLRQARGSCPDCQRRSKAHASSSPVTQRRAAASALPPPPPPPQPGWGQRPGSPPSGATPPPSALTRYHCWGNLGSVGSMKTSRLVLRFATCCSSQCT